MARCLNLKSIAQKMWWQSRFVDSAAKTNCSEQTTVTASEQHYSACDKLVRSLGGRTATSFPSLSSASSSSTCTPPTIGPVMRTRHDGDVTNRLEHLVHWRQQLNWLCVPAPSAETSCAAEQIFVTAMSCTRATLRKDGCQQYRQLVGMPDRYCDHGKL